MTSYALNFALEFLDGVQQEKLCRGALADKRDGFLGRAPSRFRDFVFVELNGFFLDHDDKIKHQHIPLRMVAGGHILAFYHVEAKLLLDFSGNGFFGVFALFDITCKEYEIFVFILQKAVFDILKNSG